MTGSSDDPTGNGRSTNGESGTGGWDELDGDGEETQGRPAQLPVEASPDRAAKVVGPATKAFADRASEPPDPSPRESLFAGVRQTRTTLLEVGQVARRLSLLPPALADARRTVRQALVSFVVGLTFVLLATMAFAGGTWRLVLGVFAGTGVATLAVFGALRGVSKLAARDGARKLPGPALAWVGAVVLAAMAITAAFTWSVSEVTKPLARPRARPRPTPVASASAAPVASVSADRADIKMKRGGRVSMGRGVLYAPPDFASEDGRFDVLIHYHGNTELIEQSVAAAHLNALVLIINLGDGSGSYSKPLRNPGAFDLMLDRIEERAADLGLRSPRLRRVALSSWSAGYGALYFILNSRSRLDRVDAVLMMDSLHGSFATGSKTKVHPISLAPFVRFGRRAIAGETLMVLTHSSIQTQGYPNTTQTANALLATLSVPREKVDPDEASPQPVELLVARNAFPTGERRWLRVTSEARSGNLYVYGCEGNGKGDHIAHLAQMSATVLPPLVERWK